MKSSLNHVFPALCLMLGASGLSGNSYVERVDWGAYLEPENRILHGAGQDPIAFEDYRDLFGEERHPILHMTYIGLLNRPDHVRNWGTSMRATLDSLNDPNVIPQVGLDMTGGTGGVGDDDVANGWKDANIEAFADALETIGRPVFVRIGYEFEGSWNGYQPTTFKQAWIRITQVLRDRNLPVATVWCAAGGSAGWVSKATLMSYYPGDEWVDWWGIDLFSREELTARALDNFLDYANDYEKPVMIGESTPRYVGVLDGQTDWNLWFKPYFDLLKRRPEIKATAYINWEWDYWAQQLGFADVWVNWGDARLEQNAYVRDQWIQEMQDPIYFHTDDYRPLLKSVATSSGQLFLAWEVPFAGPWQVGQTGDLENWQKDGAPPPVDRRIDFISTIESNQHFYRLLNY